MNLTPIVHSSAWRADHCNRETFTVELSDDHLRTIDRALHSVRDRRIELYDVTRSEFDLTGIAADIELWTSRIMDRYGLVILSGFPVDRYSIEEMEIIHWGIGCQFGTPMSQSVMGDRLGHVVNIGGKDHNERAYRNSTGLAMHSDACDVVGMMCLQKARSGGQSGYVSAIACYNEFLRRRPDLMPVLMDGFHYHRFGEELPGQSPVTEEKIPVFSFKDGYLSVNYLRAYIDLAAQELAQPLSEKQVSALDLFDQIIHDPDLALYFMTEPGDAVFFSNRTILHNRTAFEDSDGDAEKRHLLRLWLVAYQPRPTVPSLAIYEGGGIEKQEGKSTYFSRGLDYREFEKELS